MFELSLSVCVIFVIAGLMKGIVGNGLPIIAIGLLTLVLGLQEAIALTAIPAFITNAWQASRGGYFRLLFRRLWPYLLTSVLAVTLGTMLLIAVNASILTIVLGLLIATYAMSGVFGIEFRIPSLWERTAGPLFGFATGLIGGMTGSVAFPGMYFLNGLGFNRNQLVQAMGLSFATVTLSVAISMQRNNLLNMNHIALSGFATIAALAAMTAGTRIRHKMSEELFKKLFYACLLLLGFYLIIRSILRLL
jgi:uncharacterized membrane protein YfcA